jgi:hypothetical protein
MAEFFRGIVGEWVGVCKQSTDGKSADDKYFHAVVRESNPGSFDARFDYYTADATGALTRVGGSSVITTIAPSGLTATGNIAGNGEVSLDEKQRKQEHALTESITSKGPGSVEARGSGTFKVYGMPLGLGKLGKVRDDHSIWTLSNGTLSIEQNLNIVFRALCFSKIFKVDANYSAVRGSEVASQVPKSTPELTKSGG